MTLQEIKNRPEYRIFIKLCFFISDLIALLPISLLSALARLRRKPIDLGFGPVPLISSIYHKRAVQLFGYSAETFVETIWFITDDFDFRIDKCLPRPLRFLRGYLLFIKAIFSYRCIYMYMQGGPLYLNTILSRLEPWLFKIAGVKTVMLAFGGDVHELTRAKNLLFVDAMARDYPRHRFLRSEIAAQVDRWTKHGTHVVSGCDWVWYMYFWHTLMISHFAIDTEDWKEVPRRHTVVGKAPLRVLHAPNHRALKGTEYLLSAVEALRSEGKNIELIIIEKQPNAVVRQAIIDADVVADQFIIGWYAFFAIEAMAIGRPVMCYLDPRLEELYITRGLYDRDEMPIINTAHNRIKETLDWLISNRRSLEDIAKKSRSFVEKYHSLYSIGAEFDRINRQIGIQPSGYCKPGVDVSAITSKRQPESG